MVAAISGKHGDAGSGRTVDNFLDEALLLRKDLPRIDSRLCTIFSPLTKQNVDPDTIGLHIEQIREGTVLL